MTRVRTGIGLSAAILFAALIAGWIRLERATERGRDALFSATQRGIPIVVPADAIDVELRAAELVRRTLAKAADREAWSFPIQREGRGVQRHGIFVGATHRSVGIFSPRQPAPFDSAVAMVVRDGTVVVASENRESIQAAASWFLEKNLGAHWFMPGPLGEFVPLRGELSLANGSEVIRPGFLSRDLGVAGDEESRGWHARNRLEPRLDHGHNLVNIFRPKDFQRMPDMAPMRHGQRYIPAESEQNWQPNFLSSAAVEHAAEVANRAFETDPKRVSFSLSENDTVRFDDSPATLATVSPPRFFRHRPDYSSLVFRFTNEVARIVAQRHPDRWLPAYAYYWTENTPGFRIAPNVVPFLTADRNQWSHPEFAAEDKALIERWCKSGAGLVGIYEYLEGAPYLVPRPMIDAVRKSIPFEYQAGARAYYGEGAPNWAIDGAKLWLAAQLLWTPRRDPDELLAIYYREFWAEAAEPMRAFFALCERTWREDPAPPLWLRYYQDEDQSRIFSAARRAELRKLLDTARNLARTPAVRARVEFASAGWAVCERFADFCAARERVTALLRAASEPSALIAGWRQYRSARDAFVAAHARLRRERPLALGAQDLELYLRNQPDSRVARELSRTDVGRSALQQAEQLPQRFLGATAQETANLFRPANTVECLADREWKTVRPIPVGSSATIDWTELGGAWTGDGEPWEGRTVTLQPRSDGLRVLRIAGSRTEQIGQWATATANALYAAQVHLRAKSSPGTATYLIVTFLDDKNRHIGLGRTDRVPAGDSSQDIDLCVIVRAPANARHIGFGVRVLNQINDDFAEFSDASLRRLVE